MLGGPGLLETSQYLEAGCRKRPAVAVTDDHPLAENVETGPAESEVPHP
jgi:hypothetical protein